MLTPQQIQEIGFERVRRGYDMDAVDEVLGQLTQDYLTLYKDNSVLKSKMRVLVEKLEEYRSQEKEMQSTMLAAQRACEQMRADAEQKCAQMLREAEESAGAKSRNTDEQVAAEQERLAEAQDASARFLDDMEKRLKRQLELLDELRRQERLPHAEEKAQPYDYDAEQSSASTDEIIEQIDRSVGADSAKPTDSSPTRKLDTLHGSFSPEKQKIFDQLGFGTGRITNE